MGKYASIVEETTCDICGNDCKDYKWFVTMTGENGVMGEYRLPIDVCNVHGKLVYEYFNKFKEKYFTHTIERYQNKPLVDSDILIQELIVYQKGLQG